MKSEQWIRNRLKEVESDLRNDEEQNTKRSELKRKKYKQIFTGYDVADILMFGVDMGRQTALREVLEMPELKMKGVK